MAGPVQFPRQLAIQAITRVLSGNVPLDEVFSELLSKEGITSSAGGNSLNSQQIAWLHEIVSGVLRWKGRLDLAIDSVALKKKPSGWLRKALLVAAYQCIVQEKVHAALVVNETVSLVRKKEGIAPARYVNACLRKIAEHAGQWRHLPFPKLTGPRSVEESQEILLRQAAWASMPVWIWKRLLKYQGEEWACEFARACLERPTLWLRSKRVEGHEGWAVSGFGAEKGPVPFSWKVLQGGNPTSFDGFKQGEFIVQDISSQLLVTEMAHIVQVNKPGTLKVLDLCAAPGGKSVGLAWLGCAVTSTDVVEKRIDLLKETLGRTGLLAETDPSVQILNRDEVDFGLQNWIWVDAPCTGSGIIRRHPDVRWLRQEEHLASLIKIQNDLFREAYEKLPSGGFLSYSVCSVLKEEGPDHLDQLGLRAQVVKTWSLDPQNAPFGDGFWGVLLRKN